MKKLLCVVLVSSLLLATLAGASSSSLTSSLSRDQAQVLGRKGRDHYHPQISKNMQQPETIYCCVHDQEVLAVEVKKSTETKAGLAVDNGEDAEEGLIDSADYSSVAMHAGSPPKPKHKHPKP
ncbi:hypothetical protein HU200_057865 [Digitaria exilis]|uniref:Uncharacterized protein n=1 Tax=Digitaria exilis TaxID=1010633 RepID=A0A835E3Z3_9POAL|nr:hypothetical protein HU200_057865 [Digitaria exilis]